MKTTPSNGDILQEIRVLLVDDDEDDRLLVEDMLAEVRSRKYRLEWAPSVGPALELIGTGTFDVWLIDYRLGLHDGLDLLALARKVDATTPAIVLTGVESAALDERALELGAADFIVKNEVSPALLDRSIRYSLAQARALARLAESEERCQLAIEGARAGVWDWDLEADQVYLSRTFFDLLGEGRDGRFIGSEDYLDRVHAGDKETLQQSIRSALDARPELDEPRQLMALMRMRHASGEYVRLSFRGVVVRGPEQRPLRIVGVASNPDGVGKPQPSGRFAEEVLEQLRTRRFVEQTKRVNRAIREAQSLFVGDAGANDPEPLFGKLLELFIDLTGSAYGFVGVVRRDDEGRPYMVMFALSDLAWDKHTSALYAQRAAGGLEFHDLDNLFGAAIIERRTVISNDPARDPRAKGLPHGHPQLQSFMGLPIEFGGNQVGLVAVANSPAGYTEEQVRFLTPFLDACGALLVQFENYQRRQKVENEQRRRDLLLRATSEATTALLREVDLAKAYSVVLAVLGPATRALRAGVLRVMVAEDGGPQFVPIATWTADDVERSTPMDDRPVDLRAFGLAYLREKVKSGRALMARTQDLDVRSRPLFEALGVDNVVLAPVHVDGAWWGVITFMGLADAASWTDSDLELVQSAAYSVGTATALAERSRELAVANAELVHRNEELRLEMDERRRAEAALVDSEGRLRALLQGSSDVIAILDASGRFIYASPSAATVLGAGVDRTEGRALPDLVKPDERAAVESLLAEVAAEPGASERIEVHCEGENGARLTVEATVRNALSAPHVQGLILNARDVTPQRELWAQLVRAQKMEGLGRLAGGIAHDFNNLLLVIQSYARFIRQAVRPSDPIAEDVAEIERAAERAAALTRQILMFSRRQVVVPEVVNLGSILADLERMLRRIVGDDVELISTADQHIAPVKADVSQVEQILVNFVVNARDAMPRGGTVEIALRNERLGAPVTDATGEELPAGDYVSCSVRDNGDGIPDEVMQHIFEPFFSTKEPGKGTGLGLATVYGIVRQHGGGIFVSSLVGRGATFSAWLPRCHEVASERAARPVDQTRGKESIVVLDNDPGVRRLLARLLRDLGYTVHATEDPYDAILRCTHEGSGVSLLLTDVVMPIMSGPAAAAAVHEKRPGLPIVFVSGFADEVSAQESFDPRTVLPKPFTKESLARRVREALDTGSA